MEHMPVSTDTAGKITVSSERKKVRGVAPGAELWRRGVDILLVIDGADITLLSGAHAGTRWADLNTQQQTSETQRLTRLDQESLRLLQAVRATS